MAGERVTSQKKFLAKGSVCWQKRCRCPRAYHEGIQYSEWRYPRKTARYALFMRLHIVKSPTERLLWGEEKGVVAPRNRTTFIGWPVQ